MSDEMNRRMVIDHIRMSWMKGEFALSRFLLHRRFTYTGSFTRQPMNGEEYHAYIQQIRHAVTDLEVTLDEIALDGNLVVTQCTFFGTIEKAIFGFQPSPHIIAISVASFWEIESRKIIRLNSIYDVDHLKEQISHAEAVSSAQKQTPSLNH